VTPLQAAWLPIKEALDTACRQLDAETFAVFASMLTVVVARLNADQADREWRQA
jgi:hypothetical protein